MTDATDPRWLPLEVLMEPGTTAAGDFIEALTRRPEWHQRAACRGMGPAAFYPERGQSTEAAMRICVTCPVRPECLAFGVVHSPQVGIWGGASARTRRSVATMAKGPKTKQALENAKRSGT